MQGQPPKQPLSWVERTLCSMGLHRWRRIGIWERCRRCGRLELRG